MLKLDAAHPLNEGVLRFLAGRAPRKAPVAPRDSMGDAYTRLGCHPEIVERIWDTLGSRLPADCRCLVYATPALVHPASGVVFAFAGGTAYRLRLAPRGYQEALQKGWKTVQHFTLGYTEDVGQNLGPDWVFGNWKVDEVRWILAIYERLNRLAALKSRVRR